MPTTLALLVYAAALAVPTLLLYRFGSSAWYWHLLAILVALGIGFVPTPAALATPVGDLLTGAVFLFLMVWGIGAAVVFRPHHHHRAKHA